MLKELIASKHWSNITGLPPGNTFYCHPEILRRTSKLIFDELDVSRDDWREYWTVEKYLAGIIPVNKCLSICCGSGGIERRLSRLGVAGKILGIDIAPGAIAEAKRKAEAEQLNNISYQVVDLNKAALPIEEYDIIWANGALHHIENIEEVVKKLYDSLKPGGYFIANEYVGPKYFQMTSRQEEIVNAVRHLLPEELCSKKAIIGPPIFNQGLRFLMRKLNFKPKKGKVSYFGRIFAKLDRIYFKIIDPSEAISSNLIIQTLKNNFSDVEIRYFNGSILLWVLDDALDKRFLKNFSPENQKHMTLLNMLFSIEDSLIEAGEFGRDHAHIICKK